MITSRLATSWRTSRSGFSGVSSNVKEPVTRQRSWALRSWLPRQTDLGVRSRAVLQLNERVRMAFAIYAGTERVAVSEEIVVTGDGRAIEVILRAGAVTLPRPGPYDFVLFANGRRVKAQAEMFGVRR